MAYARANLSIAPWKMTFTPTVNATQGDNFRYIVQLLNLQNYPDKKTIQLPECPKLVLDPGLSEQEKQQQIMAAAFSQVSGCRPSDVHMGIAGPKFSEEQFAAFLVELGKFKHARGLGTSIKIDAPTYRALGYTGEIRDQETREVWKAGENTAVIQPIQLAPPPILSRRDAEKHLLLMQAQRQEQKMSQWMWLLGGGAAAMVLYYAVKGFRK